MRTATGRIMTLIAGAIGYSFVRRAQTASRALTAGDKS